MSSVNSAISGSLRLIQHLVRRDFELRYAGSMLGFLWSLAIPLSQLLTISFVFGRVIPLRIENFPLFVFSALLPWNWFASSLLAAGSIFTESRDLLRHPNVNPAILVVVAMLAQMLTLLLSLPILLGMVLWYGMGFPWAFLLALPLLLVIQGILITGLSLMIATANVFYRDVTHLVGIVVSLLFFLTPVWYARPSSGSYALLFDVNPMSVIVHNWRRLLIDHQGLDAYGLLAATAIGIVVLTLGYRAYRRVESDVVDAI